MGAGAIYQSRGLRAAMRRKGARVKRVGAVT